MGNRTLCDFYRELANFAIELYRRQWQSARALDGFSEAGFSTISPRYSSVARRCVSFPRLKFFRHENANMRRQQRRSTVSLPCFFPFFFFSFLSPSTGSLSSFTSSFCFLSVTVLLDAYLEGRSVSRLRGTTRRKPINFLRTTDDIYRQSFIYITLVCTRYFSRGCLASGVCANNEQGLNSPGGKTEFWFRKFFPCASIRYQID